MRENISKKRELGWKRGTKDGKRGKKGGKRGKRETVEKRDKEEKRYIMGGKRE